MTGKSVPHPIGQLAAGEEIVHARRKRRGHVNPLVLGSNPSGPTNSGILPVVAADVAKMQQTTGTCGIYLMQRHSYAQHRPG